MTLPVIILVMSFAVLILINVPVAFCMGIATVLSFLSMSDLPAFVAVAHGMATGIDSFALLAIPFFVLSGLLMANGGIARRLIDLANSLVGPFRGGLAFVNILTCMLFGAIAGSSTAALSGVGGFMIPLMSRFGYNREFSSSITITASTTGLLIPPSNIMIVYSLATGGGVSIAALFLAGYVPGILMGLGLMAVSAWMSIKNNYGKGEPTSLKAIATSFLLALPSLFLIFIVMGGILAGWFTPTEASAIAVLYAFILAVFIYKEVKLRDIPKILLQCGITTSVVFLLIGTSMAMSWVLASEHVPQNLGAALLNTSENKFVLLLLINLILLVVGFFMDMTPAVLIFTPIFLPIVQQIGIHPLHFGIIMIMNLCIGLCTPPVGTCLFLGCSIGGTTVSKLMRYIIPFFIVMVVILLITMFVPSLSMWLPDKLGLLK